MVIGSLEPKDLMESWSSSSPENACRWEGGSGREVLQDLRLER